MPSQSWTSADRLGTNARLASSVLLFAPAGVLAAATLWYNSPLLAVGAVAGLLGASLLVRHRCVWRPPASGPLIALYLLALAWVWFATRHDPDPVARLVRGGFVLVIVGLIATHDLVRTGAGPRRRAVVWGRRLAARTRWPFTPAQLAELPEVRALRDALYDDPGPANPLLADPRPEVRTSVLIALAGRRYWRPGEADVILGVIAAATEISVRAAGVTALTHATDADVVSDLAGYLRDRAPEVRHAALTALLSHSRDRWPLIRDAVRDALADPHQAADGGLTGAGRLSPLAACDLTTWAAEPEPLAGRAVRTLVAHYAVELQLGDHPALPAELARQVTDSQTPPALRVELANLLRGLNLVTPDLLDRMTDADQPSPLRVVAAEMLLAWNPHNPDAIDVLRGLGRQSNRDTALVIARLLQTYLKLDMGLPSGPVAANGKPAVEVAKRVFQWATARPTSTESPPDLSPPTRPGGTARLPGLSPTAITRASGETRRR